MLTDTMVRYELPGTYKSTIAEDIRVGFTTTDPRGFLIGLYSNITGEYLTLAVSNSGRPLFLLKLFEEVFTHVSYCYS